MRGLIVEWPMVNLVAGSASDGEHNNKETKFRISRRVMNWPPELHYLEFYGLNPTTRWARLDSGNASPSDLIVTMYVPGFEMASGEIIALSSSFETKLVGSDSPLSSTR